MALRYLADTSVLTRMHDRDVRHVFEPLAEAGEVARATISDLEIGYGARNLREWERLMLALDALEPIEMSAAHVRRARQVQRQLASRSQRGRKVPDLLIAAAAEEAGLVVLHYDVDFDQIARMTGQEVAWIVPAGSVD